MRPRTLRIVETRLKAAETQRGAAPHRPGRSQGRTLVLSLIYRADSTAAGSACAHRSSEVESPRRSCPGSHTAANVAAAFAMLPGTAATHRDHAKAPCTRYARSIWSSVVTRWGRL